jgi:DNA repair protein RecO (recombination protein O)
LSSLNKTTLSSPLHKTKAIVLRNVKYGETSLIVSALTELFGLQSYLVQGVRVSGPKTQGKAHFFQPGSLLELGVYHNEFKHLQRIKEYKWSALYNNTHTNVVKNSVLLYMIELLQKCIKQPEHNPDLFHFAEDALLQLDTANDTITANFPLFFALQLPTFFGFQMSNDPGGQLPIMDLQEGCFCATHPQHAYYLEDLAARQLNELLRVMQPYELGEISMNHYQRRVLLDALEKYYALHLPDFGSMKSLSVLQQLLE